MTNECTPLWEGNQFKAALRFVSQATELLQPRITGFQPVGAFMKHGLETRDTTKR
jgi:hypothetical protein